MFPPQEGGMFPPQEGGYVPSTPESPVGMMPLKKTICSPYICTKQLSYLPLCSDMKNYVFARSNHGFLPYTKNGFFVPGLDAYWLQLAHICSYLYCVLSDV